MTQQLVYSRSSSLVYQIIFSGCGTVAIPYIVYDIPGQALMTLYSQTVSVRRYTCTLLACVLHMHIRGPTKQAIARTLVPGLKSLESVGV